MKTEETIKHEQSIANAAMPDTASELNEHQLAEATGGMFNSLANFAGTAARDVSNAVGEAIKKSGKTGGL